MQRCPWADVSAAMQAYHDTQWGVPSRDERHLFEFLILEGAQAGLSWATVLARRAHYRRAFAGFDPARVAHFDRRHIERLLQDAGLIRNRAKLEAAVGNARAFVAVQEACGSFADYLWGFVDGVPRVNAPRSAADVPTQTPQSQALSRDLKRRGFRFVGPTICYAYMQAVGLVNDHLAECICSRGGG